MTVDDSSDAFVHETPAARAGAPRQIRALIVEHLPADWLGPFTYNPADFELSNRFCEVLADEGLLVPDWPVDVRGQDLDLASSVTIREEMWAHFEPRGGQYYGPNWIGPSIFHYGTPEQQALHLPQISAGKGWWCQGFSEPDAGSDLANMKTRAVPDGDGYRITGQKIWTSWALWAKWCYLLAHRRRRELRRRQPARRHHHLSHPDGSRGRHCSRHRRDPRPPPPLRGVPRRRVGRAGRDPRRAGQRLAGDPRRAVERACRHRPLRAATTASSPTCSPSTSTATRCHRAGGCPHACGTAWRD